MCFVFLLHAFGYATLIKSKLLILADGVGLIGAGIVIFGVVLYG